MRIETLSTDRLASMDEYWDTQYWETYYGQGLRVWMSTKRPTSRDEYEETHKYGWVLRELPVVEGNGDELIQRHCLKDILVHFRVQHVLLWEERWRKHLGPAYLGWSATEIFCFVWKPSQHTKILNGGTKEEKSDQNLTVFIAPAYGTCTVQALLSSTLPPNSAVTPLKEHVHYIYLPICWQKLLPSPTLSAHCVKFATQHQNQSTCVPIRCICPEYSISSVLIWMIFFIDFFNCEQL